MFTANIYTPLDRGMVLIQLCRWKFSHKKYGSRLYLIEFEFYSQKRQICVLSDPLGELGGKCMVDFLFAIIEHVSLTLTVETL